VIIPIIILGPISKKMIMKNGAAAFHYEAVALKNLMQSILMIKEIKIFGKINYFLDYFSNSENVFQSHQRKLYIIKTLPKQLFEIIAVVTFFIVLNLYMNFSNNNIQDFMPSLGIIILSAIRIFPSLNKVIMSLQKYQQIQKPIDEIKKDLKNNYIKNFSKDSSKLSNDNLEKFNEIKLDDIYFKYKNTENYVFQKFNLTINKFDKIGIIGHSGSGKSTLIEILMGLLKTDRGKILLNNREMQKINTEWYKLFAYVPQKVVLIDNTLISNITLEYNEANVDYQKLNDSIKFSGLKKFVNKNNGNLNIILGENGSKMSGGEKQRVAIARAVYKNPQILVFDESLNGLDVIMKEEILDSLQGYLQYKTAIFISHNTDDLKLCNKIIKID
jgi:ABC-type transport system involved in cytochrome bd biosynthesis fused ATPase/permease subunit